MRATKDLEQQSNIIISILKRVQQKGWALRGRKGELPKCMDVFKLLIKVGDSSIL